VLPANTNPELTLDHEVEEDCGVRMISAYDYYTNVVTPTLSEFFEHRADIRRALLASMTTLHIIDYVIQNRERDALAADELVKQFNKMCRKESRSFEVVEAFALASKHCRLARGNWVDFHSGAYVVRTGAFLDESRWKHYPWNDPGGVIVALNGEHNLTTALLETLEFLRKKLSESGAPPDLVEVMSTRSFTGG
jgi:hypothetical protein